MIYITGDTHGEQARFLSGIKEKMPGVPDFTPQDEILKKVIFLLSAVILASFF